MSENLLVSGFFSRNITLTLANPTIPGNPTSKFMFYQVPILYGAISSDYLDRVFQPRFIRSLQLGTVKQLPNGDFQACWTCGIYDEQAYLIAVEDILRQLRVQWLPRDDWARCNLDIFDILFKDRRFKAYDAVDKIFTAYPNGSLDADLLAL